MQFWDNLAIVDVETTGGRPPHDRVIEIGIVTIDFGQVTGKYSQLINPKQWLPPEITNLTGITSEQLADEPTFEQAANLIFPYLQGRMMVAHNVRFDLSFLKFEFARLGFSYTPKHLCSVRLSRRLNPQYRSHALDRIIERFSIKVDNRHRALDDAFVIWEFFQHLEAQIDKEKLTEAVRVLARTPALPAQVNYRIIEKLPAAPGVYIFYDKNHCPLYIGKSVNVKERVLSHFYADLESSRERAIKEQLKTIEVVIAAGDLEAQLTESRLIKELIPVYNRKLRVTRELVALSLPMGEKKYLQAELNRLETMPAKLKSVYGIYRSQKQAIETITEIVKEHQLCWKLMGLEKAKKACFGYHLGNCRGACLGKEPAASYNLRVLKAFKQKRLLEWPFKGAIAIREENEINERRVTHIFNNWQHVGTYNSTPDEAVIMSTPGEKIAHTPGEEMNKTGLDLDMYKILKRFIQKHPRQITIH